MGTSAFSLVMQRFILIITIDVIKIESLQVPSSVQSAKVSFGEGRGRKAPFQLEKTSSSAIVRQPKAGYQSGHHASTRPRETEAHRGHPCLPGRGANSLP